MPKWPRHAKADPLDRKIAAKIRQIIMSFFIFSHLPNPLQNCNSLLKFYHILYLPSAQKNIFYPVLTLVRRI